MAIPPVISNSPLLKLFRTEPTAPAQPNEGSAAGQSAEDIVEISEAAEQKLQEAQSRQVDNEGRAREVASDTGDILRANENVTLGGSRG